MKQENKSDKITSKGSISIDGYIRTTEKEKELNQLAAQTFKSEQGLQFIQYLRSITIESVGGPDITDSHLRHMEGMRYLLAIIEKRVKLGKENK